jgi:hypothetical protein
MSRTYSKAEQQDATEYLRKLLHPGDTVWTSVTHVARSGMTRWIRAFIFRDGQPEDISWYVARVVGSPVNSRNHEGVERGGCGMDMGFDLVYSLSRHLFPDGFDCLQYHVTVHGEIVDLYETSGHDRSRICPSNDHSNRVDPRELVTDGVVRHSGYALSQRWL